MAFKKVEFNDEVPIFEKVLVYKRGEYWQMRMLSSATCVTSLKLSIENEFNFV